MYPESKKNILRSGNIALIKNILEIEMIQDVWRRIYSINLKKVNLKKLF